MNAKPNIIKTPRFRRRQASVQGPDRRGGTLFQTDGAGIAGVTLQDTETAAIAAIRAGYRVADAQIERLRKIGKRVQTAGQQLAGDEPQAQAVDHAEQLVNKGILALLAWVEGLAAEPGSPLHRLAVAQYRLLGGVLGIDRDAPSAAARGVAPAGAPVPPRAARQARIDIVHAGEVRRRVMLRGIDYSGDGGQPALLDGIEFFHAEDLNAAPIQARLDGTHLEIKVGRSSPAGRWNAALCDSGGRQLGWLEIEL